MTPMPSMCEMTASVSFSFCACRILLCLTPDLFMNMATMTTASETPVTSNPIRQSMTYIKATIKSAEKALPSISAIDCITFSSTNTISEESTELILPILPAVKYPIGSFLRRAPNSIRLSANILYPAVLCNLSLKFVATICTISEAAIPAK